METWKTGENVCGLITTEDEQVIYRKIMQWKALNSLLASSIRKIERLDSIEIVAQIESLPDLEAFFLMSALRKDSHKFNLIKENYPKKYKEFSERFFKYLL